MNLQPLLDALGIQEDAAQAMANDLQTQIAELHGRPREAETHFEHLPITRKTVTTLADWLPADPPDLPEHPDFPRILAVFDEATSPLRPAMSAKPSTTNCSRRTSRAPAPS
ncbi:hypothetical protein ACFYYM_39825 [Streptomyces erythrochromogenes]|uniref:hypothetical protein n=1 Tax=Streptomyces erythrochromogenes TaxID=285574 RepID=UPI00369EE025